MSQRSRRKKRPRPVRDPVPELPELEWIPYMDTWMFVVGYTDGGAPYGSTLEDFPEKDRELLLAELEGGKQPLPPILEEEVVEVINPFALWSAETADELHRILVFQPWSRVVANHFEPFVHLRDLHRTEPSTTITSALLMLTHLKWKPAVGRLAASIARSGMLDDEQLEMLARSFVSAGEALYWRLPAHWPEAIATGPDLAAPSMDEPEGSEIGRPVVAQRPVFAPLRRWGAEYLVRSNPSIWAELYSRTEELPSRHSAAIMAGLLDASDRLAPGTQEFLIARGVGWPDQMVRRLSYKLMANRGDPQGAFDLARRDPTAAVRSWAKTLVLPPPVRRPDPEPGRRAVGAKPAAEPPQAESLF